jgi:hypothetical protein
VLVAQPDDGRRVVLWHSCCRQTSQSPYGLPEGAMDVGITKSSKNSPFHFLTGMVVVTLGFSAFMFTIRPYVVGASSSSSSSSAAQARLTTLASVDQ